MEQADADQQSIEMSMKPLRLESGDCVSVVSVGAGTPVICVPMIRELNFVYAPQLETLSQQHRVIAYEPTLSRSAHVSVDDRAQEICELLNALGLEQAHLLAWSDAGAPAYQFAKRWPERTGALAFLGLADRYRFPQPLQAGVRLLAKIPVEKVIPRFALAAILSWYLGGPEAKRRWVYARARQIHQLPRLFKHSVLPNLLEHLPVADEIASPAIVVYGDRDALVTVGQARRMAALIGEAAEMRLIPGGEHFLGYIHAHEVNETLVDFYSRWDRTCIPRSFSADAE